MSKAALKSQGSLGSRVIPVISQTQLDLQETLIRNDRRQRSLRIKARNSQSYIGKLTVRMQMSEKYLAERREKDINHRMIQGDKIDQDKVLGIGSAVDELLEIKMMLKDLRMKEKDNKTTLDAMHSIGLFLPINEIKMRRLMLRGKQKAALSLLSPKSRAKAESMFYEQQEQQEELQAVSSTSRWNEFGHGLFQSEADEPDRQSASQFNAARRPRPFSASAVPQLRRSLLGIKTKLSA
ncbi:hypothetical protein GUITHDRAFT_142072 [Guillardia theta CCMP2712]|uniref:Uncharacterized protein n=1 Tax=Guillardia theta (strain CCMP2712) TaxID=905079 RepID=L1IYS6_GUITC|nr:hypothetical protein GUITHDRAFT_142072 [Guillardia theta CCMP2712]EKX41381.1 hypothetical protein GUITHDRAFT_142072 [Guillardia theta CCMP2712]|eukprot:XP_005828361.1 hypothetical protein GUITHDRAFT_142072 [Guillardia theta CCMP2712]